MMERNESKRMSRRALTAACVVLLLGTLPGWAASGAAGEDNKDSGSSSSSSAGTANRDVDTQDLKGITKKHHYLWATAGGAALGAGIGALIPPGSGKSAAKGVLLGGGLTSFFYLASHKEAADGYRPLAFIATNTALGAGIGWSVCNCGTGSWTGALIGGGFTAIVQAVRPRHHRTLTKYTGAQPAPPPQNPPSQQSQPPVNPPPQQQPPQSPPPTSPQANPQQTTPPPDQPPDAPQPKEDR